MKKKIILALAVALTIVSSAVGTKAYLSAKEGENLQCIISASREEYELDDSIEQADAVAEIKFNGIVGEFDEGIPQTLHRASVIKAYKGELPEEINVLQDGTKQMPFSDTPLFKEGERYILVMKRTVSRADNSNSYWVLKEYFVSGNQAVETLPTGEFAAEETAIDTYDSAKNWNRAVSHKEAALPYDSEVLDKSDLVEYIEGVQ